MNRVYPVLSKVWLPVILKSSTVIARNISRLASRVQVLRTSNYHRVCCVTSYYPTRLWNHQNCKGILIQNIRNNMPQRTSFFFKSREHKLKESKKMIFFRRLQLVVTMKMQWGLYSTNSKKRKTLHYSWSTYITCCKKHGFCVDQWASCQGTFHNIFVKWHSLSANIKEQLLERIHLFPYFALQLDKSMDINKVILPCYIRYQHDKSVFRNILFISSLVHTTAEEIFNNLNEFITSHEMGWLKCIGISTVSAWAISGKLTGLVTWIKEIEPCYHCSIHRE